MAGAETTSTSPSSAVGVQVSAEHNDADTMFAQMMIPHHEQAVTMSEALLAKEGIPGQVRELVEGVIAAHGPEIERMQQMIQTWDEPISTESEGRITGPWTAARSPARSSLQSPVRG